MTNDIYSDLQDFEYSRSGKLEQEQRLCEELMGLCPNAEKRKQWRDKYIYLITHFCARTPHARDLVEALHLPERFPFTSASNCDIMDNDTGELNLDNGTADTTGTTEEENVVSGQRMKERVQTGIDEAGKPIYKWATGNNRQEVQQSIARLLSVAPATPAADMPLFGAYIDKYNATFKATSDRGNTASKRMYTVKNHIRPAFGSMPVNAIKSADIQRLFDSMVEKGLSRETILNVKNTMSPVFDLAVEDGFITANPVKSQAVKINTNKRGSHKPIPPEKIAKLRNGLSSLDYRERMVAGLLCYTGMRIGEVLGVRWEDVDFSAGTIKVVRGITHPSRNQAVIGEPKTESSTRVIPLHQRLMELLLAERKDSGYIIGDAEPLSYTQYRNAYKYIQRDFDLKGYTPHDFRDTCATEWVENGMPLLAVSNILGHRDTKVTEHHYIDFRKKSLDEARAYMGEK